MLFTNSTHAFMQMLNLLLESGDTVTVRGSTTKELTGVHIEIANPLERCYLLPHRNDNIFHKIAESLWVISGRNDVDWLEYYLPRALDFSDDGKTWRAAYGKRLRDYQGVDQIAQCIRLLKDDWTTRRAVMSIFDPTVDYQNSKDIPCNNWIHWLIREDINEDGVPERNLHMFVSQRSSDIMWGFSGINTFEWSVLQMMMARWLNVSVGKLVYSISSLHLYDKHFERAHKIIYDRLAYNNFTMYDYIDVIPSVQFDTEFENIDENMAYFWDAENELRQTGYTQQTFNDPFLDDCLQMLGVYVAIQSGMPNDIIIKRVNWLAHNDFKLAAVEYVNRKCKIGLENFHLPERLLLAYEHVMELKS